VVEICGALFGVAFNIVIVLIEEILALPDLALVAVAGTLDGVGDVAMRVWSSVPLSKVWTE
jgi:hypothetical protein